MNRSRTLLLLTLLALAAAACPAPGALMFTEDFEAPTGLSDGNWATIGHGQITTPGNGGAGHAVRFTAKGSGGDLWSKYIDGIAGNTPYWLIVDYRQTGAGGYFGIQEYNASSSDLGESWIWGDGWSYSTPAAFNLAGTGFHHYVYRFTTKANTRRIKIKLEDFSGNPSALGLVLFDNIQVSTTAPAAQAAVVRWWEVSR
jgi:hypothetical protein